MCTLFRFCWLCHRSKLCIFADRLDSSMRRGTLATTSFLFIFLALVVQILFRIFHYEFNWRQQRKNRTQFRLQSAFRSVFPAITTKRIALLLYRFTTFSRSFVQSIASNIVLYSLFESRQHFCLAVLAMCFSNSILLFTSMYTLSERKQWSIKIAIQLRCRISWTDRNTKLRCTL